MSKQLRKINNKSKNKIILDILIILFCFLCAYFLLKNSFTTSINSQLNFKESSNINYAVCLKENVFYNDACLVSNMKYVANLIDEINIDIEYNFKTNHDVTSTYTYWVKAKLVIADPLKTTNIIFTKDYDLLSKKIVKVDKSTDYSIRETILIKYDEYNTLANKFKSTYGISSIAKLEVHLFVINQGMSLESKELTYDRNGDLYLSIPLSENSINIELDSAVTNIEDSIKYYNNQAIGSKIRLALCLIMFLIGLTLLIRLLLIVNKLLYKKTEYERSLKKHLKEYDRLIVESKTKINFNDYNIIEINKFEELLDVHDNLKIPIIFNEIYKNKKSIFYIKDENDLYLFILRNNNSDNYD